MISLAPARPTQHATTHHPNRRREILRRRMAVRTLSVLVVDENADDRRRLADLLHAEGRHGIPSYDEISVRECSSGLAALEILRGRRIDVMLVDRLLPDMSGVDLISTAADLTHDTAVIQMSRAGSGPDAVAAMKCGARDYLLKRDLTAETLHAAIVEAVRTTRLEDQTNRQTRRLRHTSQRVGRLAQDAVRIDAQCEQAETSLDEMRKTPANPLRDLAAHFHHVEHSLRESRQFLAELTRLCDRAGLMKD